MTSMPTRSQLKKNLKALMARLERKPMDLDARMRMARTHRLLGEKRKAVAHYRTVARYLSLSAQPLQAIAVLKELLQVDPKHEETLLFLAKLYARTRAADASNQGRVAVPILDSHDGGPIALPEGMPMTVTGIWRAIRPQSTDVYTVVHSPDEVGAEEELSIAAELRELDEVYELDEEDVLEEVPLTNPNAAINASGGPVGDAPELHVDTSEGAPVAPSTISSVNSVNSDVGSSVDEIDGYEVLGRLTTEDILLPQVPLFSSLPPEAFIQLGHAMVFQRARSGDIIFKEGDPGDSCIVISRGRAVVSLTHDDGTEVELTRLGEGDFAGVFALMSAQKRQATLKADTDLEFFEIDRLAIAELMNAHPEGQEALERFFTERLLGNVLAILPVFSGFSSSERHDLVIRFVEKDFGAGDELFFEGAEHNGLWVVLSGAVRVGGDDEASTVALLVAGDYVGSLAGLDEGTTEVGAIATEPSRVALLTHKTIGDLLERHPDIGEMQRVFDDASLMVSKHVFAGSGRLPAGLSRLGA